MSSVSPASRFVSKQSRSSASSRRPLIESLEDRQLLTGITALITSDTVPSAVLAGAKLHSAVKVALTDSDATPEQGFTVKVYASTTTTLDTTVDPLVTSVIKTNTIRSTGSLAVNIPITALPTGLPAGTYYLIAQTTDLSGVTNSVATDSTVTVAAPFISFASDVSSTFPPSLVSGSAIKGTVRVGITNNGNIPARGVTSINVSASATAGVVGTSIATISKKVNIPVGKTVTVTLPVKNLPVLADGAYFLVADITDPNGGVTLASSPSLTIAAPFVTLTGSVAAITNPKAGATLYVTNGGNVADLTRLSGTFGVSLDAAGATPVGGTVTLTSGLLNIKPGKTVKFHVKPSKAFLSELTPGVPYFLTVSFSDATGHMGSAISPNSFTL